MPFANVTSSWATIHTTAADTAFQNRASQALYVTSEATGGLGAREGFELKPGEAIVFGTGLAIKAISPDAATALIYYTVVA